MCAASITRPHRTGVSREREGPPSDYKPASTSLAHVELNAHERVVVNKLGKLLRLSVPEKDMKGGK